MLTRLTENPQQLTRFFAESGYTQEQFRNNSLLQDLPSRIRGNLPALTEAFAERTAQNVLLRWFFLGLALERPDFEPVIPAPVIELMLQTGILAADDGRLVPAVMLTPCEGYLFAADPARKLESAESSDLVLWPNPSTKALQMFTIRRPSRSTLDLGAGCGILAILAANYSDQVVATDLNPRAAEFSGFNAWLNGIGNMECLIGDTFEPVRGRRFDLITSNPPFFVTPNSGQVYCENPMELDGYCRELVRTAPQYLNEGGYLQITFEWVQVKGQSWQDRIVEWLKDTGCDAWLLHTYARTGAAYASERIGGMIPYSGTGTDQRFAEWIEYYRARKVEQIHGGILAMRKRSGHNWIRMEHGLELDCSEPFGATVLELFANQDRLETDTTIDEMMAWKPRLTAGAYVDVQLHLVDGNWKPSSQQLRRRGALPGSMALDPQVAEFLRGCDGTRTLSELSQKLAAVVKVDPARVREQCCSVVRKLADNRLVVL